VAPARRRALARRRRSTARSGTSRACSSRVGPALLAVLCCVYIALAALPAAPGSNVVLATSGGSPDWLLGPLRFAGLHAADGPLAGPLFLVGLGLALLLYAGVLVRAGDISRRSAALVIIALHALFLLAPPLLSQDVFSYIAYARLGAEHGLNPYTHAPLDIPRDPVFSLAGSKGASSVYGPLFTLLTYPLAVLGVAGAFWALKLVAALCSLGIVALVWWGAERLGRDPRLPALAVALNPHVLVHVVGGAHNEALVVLATTAGVVAVLAGRGAVGVAGATVAAGLKASAGLVVPFLVLANSRRPGDRLVAGGGAGGRLLAAAATAVAIVLIATAAFGAEALDALGVLGSNQGRTSSFSAPYKTAELLAGLLPGDRLDYRGPVRVIFALGFAASLCVLLWRTWRGASAVAMAGWATLAVLIASAWLVPWYLLWLLPLAALADDRRLLIATVLISGWALPIAVPL